MNDGISIIDIMMRKEFDKTTFSTNLVADEGSGGATFTKRFQDDIKKIYIILEIYWARADSTLLSLDLSQEALDIW